MSVEWRNRLPSRAAVAPILIMQGTQDQIVPPALGRALFAAAPEPKEFWSSPDGGHDDLFDFGTDQAVTDFIERRVADADVRTVQ